jgi:AcrR family transcriptional regulator
MTSQKKLTKKAKILSTASAVFGRFGYDKTTLEDIGKACGLNKASLYYYFKNKEEIFVQVVMTETEEFIKNLQSETQEIEGVQAKIKHYLSERIRRYKEVINVAQLSIDSLKKVEPMFDQLYRKVKAEEIKFIEYLLKDGVKQGEISDGQISAIAESFFILSDAFKYGYIAQQGVYFEEGEDSYETASRKLTLILDIIFKGLQ